MLRGGSFARGGWAGLCAALLLLGPSVALARPSVRVDLDSFWYELAPPPVPINESGPQVLDGAGRRVLAAVSALLLGFPAEFTQPPPAEIVVRAHPRHALEDVLGIVAETTSYGGAKREDETIVIDVHRSVFVGWRALNDAELRSFLGHELIHAYQLAVGFGAERGPELWRHEIEAYVWELTHMESGVRPWYREDSRTSLEMYLGLLRGR